MFPSRAERGTRARWLELLRPKRTIKPTREGWWCLAAAIGLGLTAVNSGNNLLYLLDSMLLALIAVSGALSELSIRSIRVSGRPADEIYAGQPALFRAVVTNTRRRLASYSIAIEVLGPSRVEQTLYLPRVAARTERPIAWPVTFDTRGRKRLSGVRITTRFPFGLFLKAGRVLLDGEVIVFPAIRPVSPPALADVRAAGAHVLRRPGRGHDVRNLRDFRPGDDPRLIHWRLSAKTGVLTVREMDTETPLDVRLTIVGTGAQGSPQLEDGLSRAASLAVHFLENGAAVELAGPGFFVPRGRGRDQARRILTALALYEPSARGFRAWPEAPRGFSRTAREIRVAID